MSLPSQSVQQGLARVLDEARAWPEVRVEKTAEGVTQLVHGRGVLARVHDDGLVEIPFPRPVGEKLVAAGRAERHHALPDSGWVNVRLESADHVDGVIELLRLAYAARRPDAEPGSLAIPDDPVRAARRLQRLIDESVEDTFPASDPPAHGRE